MKKVLLVFSVLLFTTISMFAQTQIKGVVKVADSETPLPGVTITLLQQNISTKTTGTGEFNFHYGIGGRLKAKNNNNSSDDARFGLRIPLGLDYNFSNEPLEIFIEAVPVVDFSPKTDGSFNGAIGVRYYFH